jgi:hypothetical protein
MPEKLKQMQDLFFYAEAKKYNVLPLDNTTLARWNTPRPSLTAGRTVFEYAGELTGVPGAAAPNIKNRSYTITAEVEIPDGGAEGMIVTQGGRFGGYGLFLSKGEFGVGRGRAVFLYNLLDLKRTTWEGPELTAGKHTIVSEGPGLGKGGTGVLSVDGKKWLRIPWNTPLRSPSRKTRPSTSAGTPGPASDLDNAFSFAKELGTDIYRHPWYAFFIVLSLISIYMGFRLTLRPQWSVWPLHSAWCSCLRVSNATQSD